jgi:hypothetical protein
MHHHLFASSLIVLGLVVGCGSEPPEVRGHVNAITGEPCEPEPGSYQPRNPDAPDPRVDCTGHDDVDPGPGHCCEFPQPACDSHGCCDADVVVEDPNEHDGDEAEDDEDDEDDGPVVL